MTHFAKLFTALDYARDDDGKRHAVQQYFASSLPRDAAWALYLLTGKSLPRSIKSDVLLEWVAAERELPMWLVEESLAAVRDNGEGLALLASRAETPTSLPLHQVIEEFVLPLKALPLEAQHELVRKAWSKLDITECMIWHKLIIGGFHMPVTPAIVTQALSELTGVDKHTLAHRLAEDWVPSAQTYSKLIAQEDGSESRPYPFALVQSALPDQEFDPSQWIAEWKWDGIRAQLIHRNGKVYLWSQKGELLTDKFPELAQFASKLPNGTVLDGEILAWRDNAPLKRSELERRLKRKRIDAKTQTEMPCAFMAFDLLEAQGNDIRELTYIERRSRLDLLKQAAKRESVFLASPLVNFSVRRSLITHLTNSRARGVEGLILKNKNSTYTTADWRTWRAAAMGVNAVLMYVELSRDADRAFESVTLGLKDGEGFMPIAKASIELNDTEIKTLTAFVKANSIERHGPVRVLKPGLVFQLEFQSVEESSRHKSGVVLRGARVVRLVDGMDLVDRMDSLLERLT